MLFTRPEAVASNFIEKETLTQVFSSEFFQFFKKTFFTRTPPVAASARHCKSERTLLSPRTNHSEYLEIFFLEIFRKKNSRKTIIVAPNLSNISGRKCL